MNRGALILLLPFALAACGDMSLPSTPGWLGGKKDVTRLEGERIAVLKTSSQLQPDASLAALPAEIPPAAAADWPQHGGNAQANMGNLALAVTMEKRQTAAVGDGNDFEFKLIPPPVAAAGAVYAMDAEGYISAHDAKDVSEVRWISPAAAEKGEAVIGGGLGYGEGKVIGVSGKGLAVALDAQTGVERWRQALNTPVRAAPRIDAGRVYIVTVDSQLFALDAASGAVLWSHRGVNEGAGFLIEATPAALTDLVVAPYCSGEFHVLRADSGEEAWSDAVLSSQRQSASSVLAGIGGDPVIAGGLLYVSGSSGVLSAFALESGRRVWDQQLASVTTPWLAGDSLYVLTTDAAIVALNRMDGRVRWVAQLPAYDDPGNRKDRYTWNGPVMAGGRLLVTGAHGEMMELSPQDGSVMAKTDIPSGIYSAPVVSDGVLYVVSDDATLYALY